VARWHPPPHPKPAHATIEALAAAHTGTLLIHKRVGTVLFGRNPKIRKFLISLLELSTRECWHWHLSTQKVNKNLGRNFKFPQVVSKFFSQACAYLYDKHGLMIFLLFNNNPNLCALSLDYDFLQHVLILDSFSLCLIY
jgi:hypothetical protein